MELAITPKYSWNQIPTGEIIVQIKIKIALRGPITTTTSLRTMCSGMVISTSSAPTVWIGVSAGGEYPNVKCKNRSPEVVSGYDVSAYHVELDGIVDVGAWDLNYSYGRSSPYVYTDYDVCYVYNGGGVGISGDDDVHWGSCGIRSPNTTYTSSAWRVYPDGDVGYFSRYDVTVSYGRNHCPSKSQISLSVDQ